MDYYNGKLVYLTGGTSGIGFELAKLLASHGAEIVLLARNKARLEKASQEIKKFTLSPEQRVIPLSLDVAEEETVEKTLEEAASLYGSPDLLILSAGILKYANTFEEIDYSSFNEVISINLFGVRNVIAALIGRLKENKGQIVIISSMAGLIGMYGYTAYSTSKAALTGFAESLRYELKPHGVLVTLVCPPEVDTPMIVEERATLPQAGRAVKNLAGILKPEVVARTILKASAKGKFLVIPGFTANFLYTLHRLSNGKLTRLVADQIIKRNLK